MKDLSKEEEILYLKIKSDLSESTEKKVNELLEKDRNLIKETVSTISKVLLFVIALVSIVLTFLGIKTYGDVESKIEKARKEALQDELSKTTFLKIYENEAKKMYLNSIVESTLITIEKNKGNIFWDNKIPDEQSSYLTNALSDENISYEMFSDILYILKTMETNESRIELESLIKNILDEKLELKYERERKLIAILRNRNVIENKEITSLVIDKILKNPTASDSELIAAMDYLKVSNDFSIIPELEELSENKNKEIKEQAIITLAYIDFSNQKVLDFVDKYFQGNLSLNEASTIIDISNSSLEGFYERDRERIFEEPDEQDENLCRKIASNNIKKILDKNIKFTLYKRRFRNDEVSWMIYSKDNPNSFYGIKRNLFFKYHIENDILTEVSKSKNTFIKYLQSLNDIDGLKRREELARIIVDFEKDKNISFKDMDISEKELGEKTVLFVNKKAQLMARWWDYSGKLIIKEVKDLSGFREFRFTARATIEDEEF